MPNDAPEGEHVWVRNLKLWPASTCLASHLINHLAQVPQSSLAKMAIVLPTMRLATWVAAGVAKKRGAFFEPRWFNLKQFIGEHTSPPSSLVVERDEQELLIGKILSLGCFDHVRPGDEHEIVQIFNEWSGWRIELPTLSLKKAIEDNPWHSEAAKKTMLMRAEELLRIWLAYRHELQNIDGIAEIDQLMAAADELGKEASRLPYERILFVGFTSLSAGYLPLLRQLLARSGSEMWLNRPPRLVSHDSPLLKLIADLDVDQSETVAYDKATKLDNFRVHRALDASAETKLAFQLIDEAIDAGIPPSQIGLLVTSDQTYSGHIAAQLAETMRHVNVAIAQPLVQTFFGAWLTSLFRLWEKEQSCDSILEFISHPLTLPSLDVAQATAAKRAEICHEICKTGVVRGLSEILENPSLSRSTRGALEKLKDLLELPQKGSTRDWWPRLAMHLRATLDHLNTRHPPGMSPENQSLVQAVQLFLTRTDRFVARVDTPAEALIRWLKDTLTQLEVRRVGHPLAGVQVLSIEEARSIPFATTILLGCTEGCLPKRRPRDRLFDNYLKVRTGLPGWRDLEAIEETTFLLLTQQSPRLECLYHCTDTDPGGVGEVVGRSRFLEALLAATPERFLDHTLEDVGDVLQDDADEHLGCDQTLLSPKGEIDAGTLEKGYDPLSRFSASSLTALISCPYQFLLASLRVTPQERPGMYQARLEGEWLHGVLQAFFTGSVDGKLIIEDIDPHVPWSEVADYTTRRLNAIAERTVPPHIRMEPAFLHTKVRSWPAFAKHLTRIYTPNTWHRTLAGLRELMLKVRNESDVLLTAKIDALDIPDPGGPAILTDYKRRYIASRGQVEKGETPQLGFYAFVATLEPELGLDLDRMILAYYNILDGEFTVMAKGQAAEASYATRRLPQVREVIQKMQSLWQWRLAEIKKNGRYEPDDSQCGLCEFAGLCRRDDPAFVEHFRTAKRLGSQERAGRDGSER